MQVLSRTNSPAVAPNGFAIVMWWLAGALALLGGYHAVAADPAAIMGVVPIDSAGTPTGPVTTNAIGRVGRAFRYGIVVTNSGVNPQQTYYSASPLPLGLTINTNVGGNGWITGTPTAAGVYSPVRLAAGNSDFVGDATLDIRIVVRASEASPPVITVRPVNQAVQPGADVLFAVAATGSPPLGYNWRFNGVSISGATTTSLQLTNVQTADSGTYSVSVTNSAGTASASATLTVDSGSNGPSIIAQPQSLTTSNGATASFSVTAGGTSPLSYQWLNETSNLPGATNSTYSISPVTTNDAGNYSVLITNSFGSVTSSLAILTVLLPPAILTPPQSLTVTSGGTARFSVSASGSPPLSYQWLFNGSALAGATSFSFTLSNVQLANQGNYSVVVSNAVGSVTSPVARLTVPTLAGYTLVGWSETGLHETDGADVSVYALAPPYSTIHAQVISGGLLVTNSTGLTVTYEAIADGTGSINTTSQGKGNFYQYAQSLYGVALAADEGLAGFGMPGTNNQPQKMTFDPAQNCFTAEGIPITPYDDQGRKNYFPMMRLVVRDSINNVLARSDIALPVSDEMDCRACHASGSQTAARPPSGWAWHTDPQKDYKLNVLRSHDDHFLGTVKYTQVLSLVGYNKAGLVATVVRDSQPVLCIRCHSSGVLPNTGAPAMRPLTQLMHTKHAFVEDPQSGSVLTSLTNSSSCLLCHAGPENRLMRGVHHNAIGTDGSLSMQCQSCHGSISVVGAAGRQGWLDEPSCQSCHTGTALTNSGSLSFTSVFEVSGQTRQPKDLTYATQTNNPAAGLALFRSSHGHGGLNCAACHGAAHAEWLSAQPNENLQSQQLQNSAGGGVLTDCAACHPTRPTQRTGGPHGMHPVDAQWASNHEQNNRTQCQACHGTDSRGTTLSLAQGNRNYSADGVRLWQGFQVGCYNCHAGPGGGDNGTSGNSAPTVANLSANAIAGTPVAVALAGSDPNGNPLSFRIVSQPVHGTVNLSGNSATYFPDPSFVGADSFTYAAWDGSTDSTLGTVALTAASGQCLLTASVLAPTAAYPNSAVPFRAVAALTQCSSAVAYDWDFGDSSPHGSGTNVAHNYSLAADYHWTLKVSANGANQTVSGVVTVSPTLGAPITLTLAPSDFMLTVSWPADSIPTALETAYDLTDPFAWQPDITDPVFSDGTNNTVQVFPAPGQQLFRVRRLP